MKDVFILSVIIFNKLYSLNRMAKVESAAKSTLKEMSDPWGPTNLQKPLRWNLPFISSSLNT